MKDSRRMKRMERNNRTGQEVTGLGLNLIPMMDVLCVLVFFLLFHSFNGDMPEQRIALPDSVVEAKPRETVVIVIGTSQLLDDSIGIVHEVRQRLRQLQFNSTGTSIETDPERREITLLADKTIPFKVLKKIMTTCTASGYGRISLAVEQKAVKS